MADEPDPDKLRQMAEHRGLKLVRSRRRKAGVGDYGMFGLTEAAGKPLLGIGKDGLTASAADIAAYLRAGTLGTWRKSANAAPDKPSPSPPPAKTAAPAKAKTEPKPTPTRAKPPKQAAPPPAPKLVVRPAAPADAGAVATLLSRLGGTTIATATARRNLASVQHAGGGMLLAELGEPVGCCGWAVVPTVHRGPIGRITALFVGKDHRRQGIATRLLQAAEQALASAGCATVEVMSDIQIDNAHNFFRARKFAQTSYRFTRTPAAAD